MNTEPFEFYCLLHEIGGNSYLTSLNGLENLTSIGNRVLVDSNNALTNVCSLYKVTGLNSLRITNHDLLSMETAYAFETQLRSNGFTGTADISNNNGSGLVSCDIDNDTVTDAADNCPNICNPNQLDADSDGLGDVCDASPGCGGISCGVPQPECEEVCGGG
jgi:hypothetical protein